MAVVKEVIMPYCDAFTTVYHKKVGNLIGLLQNKVVETQLFNLVHKKKNVLC